MLLTVSSWAYADDGREACLEFKIVVQNNTQDICYLINQTLESGYLKPHIPVVYKIMPSQASSMIFQQYMTAGPQVMLTYQCGNGEVTFESQKSLCATGGVIDGTLISAAGMDASFASEPGNFWRQQRGVIHWTLSK